MDSPTDTCENTIQSNTITLITGDNKVLLLSRHEFDELRALKELISNCNSSCDNINLPGFITFSILHDTVYGFINNFNTIESCVTGIKVCNYLGYEKMLPMLYKQLLCYLTVDDLYEIRCQVFGRPCEEELLQLQYIWYRLDIPMFRKHSEQQNQKDNNKKLNTKTTVCGSMDPQNVSEICSEAPWPVYNPTNWCRFEAQYKLPIVDAHNKNDIMSQYEKLYQEFMSLSLCFCAKKLQLLHNVFHNLTILKMSAMYVKLFHPHLYLLQFPVDDNFKVHVYLDDAHIQNTPPLWYDDDNDDDNESQSVETMSLYKRLTIFDPQSSHTMFMKIFKRYRPKLQQNGAVDSMIASIRLKLFTDTKLKSICKSYGIHHLEDDFNRDMVINVLKLWYKY